MILVLLFFILVGVILYILLWSTENTKSIEEKKDVKIYLYTMKDNKKSILINWLIPNKIRDLDLE